MPATMIGERRSPDSHHFSRVPFGDEVIGDGFGDTLKEVGRNEFVRRLGEKEKDFGHLSLMWLQISLEIWIEIEQK